MSLIVGTGTAVGTVVFFLLFLFVEAGQVAVGQDVVLYAGVCLDSVLIKTQRLLPLAVHGYYLKCALGSDGLHV